MEEDKEEEDVLDYMAQDVERQDEVQASQEEKLTKYLGECFAKLSHT